MQTSSTFIHQRKYSNQSNGVCLRLNIVSPERLWTEQPWDCKCWLLFVLPVLYNRQNNLCKIYTLPNLLLTLNKTLPVDVKLFITKFEGKCTVHFSYIKVARLLSNDIVQLWATRAPPLSNQQKIKRNCGARERWKFQIGYISPRSELL